MSSNPDAPEGTHEVGDRAGGLSGEDRRSGTDASGAPDLEVGDRIVQYLERLGVEYVFGVPGGAIEPLYNALARSARRGGPRPVLARHESGAAFMADGYARETGRIGVCCATTGPGATNLITGVATSYENEIPLLVITAQTTLSTLGRRALQESSDTAVDTLGMFRFCTRYNSFVSHPSQLDHKLVAALLAAHRRPRGPSHLTVPLDVLRGPAARADSVPDLERLIAVPQGADPAALSRLERELLEANHLVIVIGGGSGHAIGSILEVARLLDAAIVATPHGKGLVSAYHPKFRGVFGFAGHRSASEALSDPTVDRVLAVGAILGEFASGAWDERALLNSRLIHIDDTAEHFARSPMARLHVHADLPTVFDRLVERLHRRRYPGSVYLRARRQGTLDRADMDGDGHHRLPMPDPDAFSMRFRLDGENHDQGDASPLKPQRLMIELARRFPFSTRFLADSGNSFAWAIHYLHPFDRRVSGGRGREGGLFRACLEFAPMGWAIGAAVGTALARRDVPVVCITGDGSLLMNGQELTVAVAESLPVVFVVLNDAALGMVRHGQRLAGSEPIAHCLPPVDFAAAARAMGADGFVVGCAADLEALDFEAMCIRPGPTVLDCRIDPDEVPPMGMRMKVLGTDS